MAITSGAGKAFDFAKGNLEKLIRIPFYGLGAVAAKLVPRSPRQWVFGSGAGVGQGALELWREVGIRDRQARSTWLTHSEQEAHDAAALGLSSVPAQSWRGFVRTLRAGNVVITHGFGDVNRYASSGAFVVQLWHGVPLKLIQLDSPATLNLGRRVPGFVTRSLRSAYRRASRRIGLFPVPSALVAQRVRTAFGLPSASVVVTGDPRDEVLLRGTASSRRADALDLLSAAGMDCTRQGVRLVLMAPTWRDGEEDPSVPTEAEADALQSLAADLDLLLVFRPHPLGRGAYEAAVAGHDRLVMAGTARLPDVNQVLAAFDVLITDYSSVATEFSLTGGHLLFLAPDLEHYEGSRGLYEPYVATVGEYSTDWTQLGERLRRLLSDEAEAARSRARTVALRQRFYDVLSPGAPGRVYDAVCAGRTGAETTAAAHQVVFFESFYGTRANDNPAGIDAALARERPETVRYWSVASDDVEVPPGAIAVREGSEDWKRARRAADLFVVNDWLRTPVPDRGRQPVIQTWHGTPLKNLALARPGVSLRTKLASLRQSRRWQVLLTQNAYSTRRLAGDYGYKGAVWESGYPRNDALATGDREAARASLSELGVAPGTRVVLYAPTWRDDGRIVLDGDGLRELRRRLGEDTLILVRAHSRVPGGLGSGGVGVVDVSTRNDLDTLLLAADVVVTDYSSLMFDAAVTGVPLIFHVPDLARYRDEDRGFGFDLAAEAPGPLTTTSDELVEAIQDARRGNPDHAEAYSRWVETYVPLDDGDAGARVVSRLIAEGFLV
ncbi:MAG: CDP-glycerol glycerophosphotransferase family protein [Galactobacter sp.]